MVSAGVPIRPAHVSQLAFFDLLRPLNIIKNVCRIVNSQAPSEKISADFDVLLGLAQSSGIGHFCDLRQTFSAVANAFVTM